MTNTHGGVDSRQREALGQKSYSCKSAACWRATKDQCGWRKESRRRGEERLGGPNHGLRTNGRDCLLNCHCADTPGKSMMMFTWITFDFFATSFQLLCLFSWV